jgi:protein-disulfide isomerase
MSRMRWVALLLCTVLFLGNAHTIGADSTVAKVGTSVITQEELNRAVGNRLMRIRTEEYMIRTSALDELIADHLLRAEAARRNVTLDQLMTAEVDDRVATPTEEDLETFYEGTAERFGGVPKEEAMRQIADGIRRQKTAKRKKELVNQLRAAAGVKVMLDPPRAEVKAEGPSRGNTAAPVTIVVFSDFECAYCGRSIETLKRLEQTYGEQLRIVYRDFPLPSHSGAIKAAEAAQCANEQGRFWEMHDRLFAKSSVSGPVDLTKIATETGVDMEQFRVCVASAKHTRSVMSSREEGLAAGVASTPTFFVNGRMVIGAVPYDLFASIVEDEIVRTRPPTRNAATTSAR